MNLTCQLLCPSRSYRSDPDVRLGRQYLAKTPTGQMGLSSCYETPSHQSSDLFSTPGTQPYHDASSEVQAATATRIRKESMYAPGNHHATVGIESRP